ncbi:MAG: biopolymer transporter ExbD, partial [Crocinitomicaceae bacterium]|nr:biopolymer transporter ExbD [Crocinitomicaceae bacterium]
MNFGSRNKVKVDGGMASMTDLVFLLLIFFIIMALMSNPTARVDVPKDSNHPPETNPVAAGVVVTEDNLYYVLPHDSENQARPFEEIQKEVNAAIAGSGDTKLKIEGHKNADYEAVFKVL